MFGTPPGSMLHGKKIGFMLVLGFATSCRVFALDLTAYDWRARITGDLATGMLHKVRLPPDLADRMKAFPLDIRVVDEKGTSWPAMVWAGEQTEQVDPVSSVRIGESMDRDESGAVRLLLRTRSMTSNQSPPAHNRAIISLGGSECRRIVEVWTGADPASMEFRARGLIVEQSTPVAFRRRTVDYTRSSDPYVEIRIQDDRQRPDAPLSVRAIELADVKGEKSEAVEIEAHRLDAPADEVPRDGTGVIYLDTGSRNLPVVHIDLDFTQQGVFPVRVQGRNDPVDPWRWVGDGVVLNVDDARQSRLALDRSPYRYLQVVLHPDGKTLPEIDKARAGLLAHFVVFKPLTARPAYLFAGAELYQLPAVSFVRTVNEASVRDAQEAVLAKMHENPARVASSLHHYSTMLFKAGGLLVLLLIMLFFARKIRDRLLS